MFDLSNKKALVTGSTQGIGFEIARTLALYGAKVFVHCANNFEKCTEASKKIQNSVPVTADLLEADAAELLYKKTGDVDILILNASIQHKKSWDEFTLEEYEQQMNCNVRSTYFLIKKYASGMKKRGFGRIVTLGSTNQYVQHPELSLYSVTKAAQFKMVQNFSAALAPMGITINNISPGAICTPRNAEIYNDPIRRSAVEEKIPCGRFGTPKDIAPAVLLLCSDEGSYITGSDIVIDGGLSKKY